ncbi:50S ribosomal protein L21e [Candidatus Woesearchaeota archaeon]|nr:50S ribosomal protein L21e [Candidatus Woesearchaeota archaeon]
MVQRIGGNRRKTRTIMKKPLRNKGKISISKYFQVLKENDRVLLKAEPAVQTGLYFRRFHGKTGLIKGKQGECYKILIKDGNKQKEVLVHPVHLRKMGE